MLIELVQKSDCLTLPFLKVGSLSNDTWGLGFGAGQRRLPAITCHLHLLMDTSDLVFTRPSFEHHLFVIPSVTPVAASLHFVSLVIAVLPMTPAS